MTQLAILFPPPLTPRQLAGAEKLARDVAERRARYETRRFVERRAAALKGIRNA